MVLQVEVIDWLSK